MPKENKEKELPLIEDKIQQIFKFLEVADVSQWQGMNVFEAGDADSLYGILKTAFEQVLHSKETELLQRVEGIQGYIDENRNKIERIDRYVIDEISSKLKELKKIYG